ncbi:hypothetical protein OLMES_2925 [Oleiphilus messinensis]|uniref:Uncharacterized protein n=1 Tax=Oleiphilus messinensis TaxID=141451 RepID=A0A1Y0I9X8_9GAMM|nr:hypothetical protein OLMES_2925 [Oleiphilus messinensis]
MTVVGGDRTLESGRFYHVCSEIFNSIVWKNNHNMLRHVGDSGATSVQEQILLGSGNEKRFKPEDAARIIVRF